MLLMQSKKFLIKKKRERNFLIKKVKRKQITISTHGTFSFHHFYFFHNNQIKISNFHGEIKEGKISYPEYGYLLGGKEKEIKERGKV